jgi:hypothetical protein
VRVSAFLGIVASAAGCLALGARVAAAQSPSPSPMETAVACGSAVITEQGSGGQALHVIGAQDTVARTIFDNRDLLVIDGGTDKGVQIGQEYYVRGGVRLGPMPYELVKSPTIRTAGWVRIVAANERTSIAQVIHACGVLLRGDYLEAYAPPTVPAGVDRDEQTGEPDFTALGHIISGPADRTTAAMGEFVRIDRGTDQGVTPGTRFAVYRDLSQPGMPLASVGDIIVVTAGKKESLARVTRSRDALMARDYVAPRK